jgi:hypothetical protein
LIASPGLAAAKSVVRSHTIIGVSFVALYVLNALPFMHFILIKMPGIPEVELVTPILNNSVDSSE